MQTSADAILSISTARTCHNRFSSTPSPGGASMQQSSILLLLLFCPWTVNCSRRPPSISMERDQSYHSPERRQPPYFFTQPDTLKRSQPKNMRKPRSLEDIGCQPTDGTAYTGKANTTESGLTCQMWSVHTPHDHSYTVEEHNYCRSPDGHSTAWCLTTNPGMQWEFCDVPLCVTYTKGMNKAPTCKL